MTSFVAALKSKEKNITKSDFQQYIEEREVSYKDFQKKLDNKVEEILDNVKHIPKADPNYPVFNKAGLFYKELLSIFSDEKHTPSFHDIQECGERFLGEKGGEQATSFVEKIIRNIRLEKGQPACINEQEMIGAMNNLKKSHDVAKKAGGLAPKYWKDIVAETKETLYGEANSTMGI